MATKRTSNAQPPSPPLELTMSIDDARTRLHERIDKGRELRQRPVQARETFDALSRDYSKWDSFNSELLKRMFTNDEMAREYDFWGVAVSMGQPSLGEQIREAQEDIDKKIHRLDSIIERLELIPISSSTTQSATARKDPSPSQSRTKKVFVVHGRDEVAKTSLEVFLHEMGLEPIVLHRQADEGLTVIEKFEKHSDVGYAFILLTPDEVAYLKTEESKPDQDRTKESRARPNVIFEFGYFVGKLGRSRVCCLYTGNVTLPSDVSGMIYKRYEKVVDEVAYSIIKDLRASGYAIA